MSIQQWGGVFLRIADPDPVRTNGPQPKLWRIGNERKTLKDWVRDPRNTLGLTKSGIKCRIDRAEKQERVLQIADLQAPQERYSRRAKSDHEWRRQMKTGLKP
jgi:hypothetical protein